MEVDILGTKYKVKYSDGDDKTLKSLKYYKADGLCEYMSKDILIRAYKQSDDVMKDIIKYEKRVLRHEIIHAFLYEGGLTDMSHNEILVDWLAVQFPKMIETILNAESEFDKISVNFDGELDEEFWKEAPMGLRVLVWDREDDEEPAEAHFVSYSRNESLEMRYKVLINDRLVNFKYCKLQRGV